MNLIQGVPVKADEMQQVLSQLPQSIDNTLQNPPLDPMRVIDACDSLVATLKDEEVLPVLKSLGMGTTQARTQLGHLRLMFSKEYLIQRLQTELGANYGKMTSTKPYGCTNQVQEQIYPLGVLFHIAAGNMDGLPVYSVIEGLLTGNINLLKLPAVDGGLSIMLLQRLFSIAPQLAEYVYVFELSSQDTTSMQQLANLADAVIVWGGDDAVQAVRNMTPPEVRIIEWGHKLSFAYVTKAGMGKSKLEALAHHVCETNQLLCSSCQGVFIDSQDENEALQFCNTFLPILEKVAKEYPHIPLSAKAQNTLKLRARLLEQAYGDTAQIFQGKGVSLVFENNSELAPSFQFRNLWIKCLPNDKMVAALHPHKNHLQTTALLCSPQEWTPLRNKLWRAGVVRVCASAKEMPGSHCGAAHDGEYPLRRYTRIVCAVK